MKIICLRIMCLLILLSPLQGWAQEHILRGVVTDVSGPLIGATVAFNNKENRALFGVVTDVNGEYFIRIPAGQDIANVVFSFVGYKTKSIKYTKQTKLDVRLEEDSQTLDEAVVVGRAIHRDIMGMDTKALGGARQKINLDDLQDMVVTSVGDMLQGKLANVDLIAASGAPGAKMSIRIRGTASLNASNEPLIVIDDVPMDVSINSDFDFGTATEEDFGALVNIAPSDIESIEVLKDASATAMWGAKAANGVLQITTKRGAKSKPTFQISEKISTSIEPKRMPQLNGKEYVTLMQDAIWNRVRDNEYKDLSLLNTFQDIRFNPNYQYFREFNQDVDWLDYLVRTPINSETNFNMSGGGDKATYRFSVGYLTEKGTTVGEDFKRITARLNLDYRFSNKLIVRSQFSYAEGDRNSMYSHSSGNPRSIAQRKMPNLTPFVLDADGNFTDEYFIQPTGSIQGSLLNPVALANDAQSNTINREAGVNFQVDYSIITGLKFVGTVAFNLKTSKYKSLLPVSATGVSMDDSQYNLSQDSKNSSNSLFINVGFNYSKSFNEKHTIGASTRFQAQDVASGAYFNSSNGNASGFLSDPANNGALQSLQASKSQSRSVAVVGSFMYSYKNRVNLNAAFRTDGSSNTGRQSRWGTFPSLSASWYMQYEPFLQGAKSWLYELKPRIGWGKSGSSPSGSSTYAGTFAALDDRYVDLTAIIPNSIQLNRLKWETQTQQNYGIDVGIKEDKFHLTLDYYIKTTHDLLQKNMTIQSTTGYSTVPWFNSGSLQNRGWEVYLRMSDVVRYGDFRVNVDFNISRNRNKVLELPVTLEYVTPNVTNGAYTNKVMEGRPLGSFFGFRYMGVYQNYDETIARDRDGNVIKDSEGKNVTTRINGTFRQRPGDAKYYDVNYDGIIDKYDVVYLGNSQPLVLGGGSITFFYRGLSLRTSVAYRIGQSIINRALLNAENMGSANNQSTSVLRRWRYEGDDTNIPRALYGENYNSLGSDRYVEKASFLKFKDITLSYRFQKRALQKMGLRGLNIYLTSYDPFTISKYKGQDPEVGTPSNFSSFAEDNSLSPRARRFAFGITVDF